MLPAARPSRVAIAASGEQMVPQLIAGFVSATLIIGVIFLQAMQGCCARCLRSRLLSGTPTTA